MRISMVSGLMCGAAVLVLSACSKADVPNEAPETAVVTPAVAYETPRFSEADRSSPVAAYVMANGASAARISPDGSFMAMSASKTGEAQLYVGSPDGLNLKQVTDGAGISFFDILPTGDIIYGADNNGDERENYFLYDVAKGVSTLILPATEKGFRQYGGASANGETIAFASTERNGLDFDIYTMPLVSGAPNLVYEGKFGNYVEAVNEDATTLILSETVGEDANKLFILNTETGERSVLSDPSPRANHTDSGVFFLNNETIRLATNTGREFLSLTDVNIATGTMTTIYQTDADVDEIDICGDQTFFTINRDGFSGLYELTDATPIRRTGLPSGVYDVDCNGNDALIRVSGPDRAGDVFRLNLQSGRLTRIYESDMRGLNSATLIAPTSVRMKARDGVELQGLLYLPRTEDETKPPVVFDVHGGPTAQAKPYYSADTQYLLSRGIAVFQTNVRGSTGFGRTYTTLDDRRNRLDSIRDLVDMLDGLKADGRVDTDRAAVMGGSYGGYAVNAVLSEYPDAFIAGVSLYGVADWVTALEVASPALKAADLIEYGNIEEPEWREFYTAESPIRNADKINVPVLFSHGAMDPRIDIAETETMVKALRERGIEAGYIRFPDEGHGWRKLDNRLYYQRRQAEFLEAVLGVK